LLHNCFATSSQLTNDKFYHFVMTIVIHRFVEVQKQKVLENRQLGFVATLYTLIGSVAKV